MVFFLREEVENSTDEAGTRYELRRKYWAYALEFIKEAQGENAPFCNVNPSKENWINGFFGISGFSLCCVANYDGARVELYLGKSQGKLDILLVFMFDRIGRIADETPFVVEWFCKHGIQVWSTQEGEQRFDNLTDRLVNFIRF